MFKKIKLFFIIAETPLHPGSGGELGLVDLPIQREKYTDFPKIEASGLKGCIREAFESSTKTIQLNSQTINVNDKNLISLVFGPEDGEAHAGALAFTDARILLFPVKSLKGVFAWITCPMVLERFKEDLNLADKIPDELKVDFSTLENTLPQQTNICIESKVVLEEYTFEVRESETTSKIAEFLSEKIFPDTNTNAPYKFWRKKLEKDLVILSNDDFTQFVKTSTEIITRTKIDNKTGTVASGALWTEEYLPQDTILYSLAMASPVRVEKEEAKGVLKGNTPEEEAKKVLEFFESGCPEVLQIGGNQTIGKGLVRIQIFK
ncbi:type III-B CRISPR module RAMP protein Cmr4 [Caldisericum exile]|uniref:type III-B CRISPR module RAMP protein Cmr4 n=1 Tax=Caldisericum exile TaxID=693075 RepID=UPI003C769C05